MAFGLLEKIGHLFLKKLYPHLPFESYFSKYRYNNHDHERGVLVIVLAAIAVTMI